MPSNPTPTDPQGAGESATNTGVSRHSSDVRDNTAPSEDAVLRINPENGTANIRAQTKRIEGSLEAFGDLIAQRSRHHNWLTIEATDEGSVQMVFSRRNNG